jgi:hypothetical protein
MPMLSPRRRGAEASIVAAMLVGVSPIGEAHQDAHGDQAAPSPPPH